MSFVINKTQIGNIENVIRYLLKNREINIVRVTLIDSGGNQLEHNLSGLVDWSSS